MRLAKRFPFRLQVTAKEFYYSLSSRTAPAGAAVIEFVNYGEDPHDMRLQRAGGGRLYKTPIMQPGQYYDLTVKLAAAVVTTSGAASGTTASSACRRCSRSSRDEPVTGAGECLRMSALFAW